jgi:hypothetical protein
MIHQIKGQLKQFYKTLQVFNMTTIRHSAHVKTMCEFFQNFARVSRVIIVATATSVMFLVQEDQLVVETHTHYPL